MEDFDFTDPKTEIEYWLRLKQVNQYIEKIINDKRRLKKRTSPARKILWEARRLKRLLAKGIREKFGVAITINGNVAEKADIPNSKMSFKKWQDRCELMHFEKFYKKSICSKCLFSGGIVLFKKMRRIPCVYSSKMVKEMKALDDCPELLDKVRKEKLYAKLARVSGATEAFNRRLGHIKRMREKK